MRRLVPDSLFGRLLAAMLAAIGVTLVVIVALLLQERRETLFSGSETAAVVTAIADTAGTLAALPPAASVRRRSSACSASRLRLAGQLRRPRPPGQDGEDLRACGALTALAARARARQPATRCNVAPARPGPADVITVGVRRASFGPGRPPRGPDSPGGRGVARRAFPRPPRRSGRAAARTRRGCDVARRRRRDVPHGRAALGAAVAVAAAARARLRRARARRRSVCHGAHDHAAACRARDRSRRGRPRRAHAAA